MECVIFIGAQACGKSTFYAERFFRTHVRINLDMLKTRHRERLLIEACISARQPFVVDNTNPRVVDRRRYLEPALGNDFRVTGFYFESRLADALRRNAGRPGGQRIPDAGVRGTHASLELPARSEGFDALYYVRMAEQGGFVVEDWKDEV